MPFFTLSRKLNSFSFIAVVVFLSALLTTVAFPADANTRSEKFVRGEILVKPRAGLGKGRFSNLLGPQGGKSKHEIHGIGVHVISVPEHAEERVRDALSRNPNIEFAELNRYINVTEYTPNDPEYGSAWHLQTMNLPGAWDVTRGGGVTVAILDTGVNASHEDLSGKLVAGRNVVSNNSDTSDVHGHGTKVAGVVGAVMDNNLGVASIAPDAMIMPIRITNSTDGWATTSAMATGITWASDNGARIANISYEATDSATVRNAADYMRSRGGMVVAAAGNSGSLTNTQDSSSIITVSATDRNDGIASWSNYGPSIDVAAPGTGLRTTTSAGGYASVSGTSFAAPATAATIAMIMSVDGSLTPGDVEIILEDSAVDLGNSGRDDQYGHGRVDTLAAVQLAGGEPVPDIDLTAPTVAINSPANNSVVSGVVNVDASAADNVAVVQVSLYAGNTLVGTDYSSPYRFSWDAGSASAGDTVVLRAVAADSSGNTGETTISLTVADSAPPVISRPPNKTVEATGQLTAVSLGTATATDDADGAVPVMASTTGPFTVGRHEVVWTASDSAGNTATAVQVVTVRDTRAPVVSAPGDRTVEASGDLTSVNLGNGTATDVVDGSIVPTPTPAGPFAVGTHTVTWGATDSAGNTGTDTQRVTVTQPDSSAPNITPPRNKTVEATGRLTAVSLGTATATDDTDGAVPVTASTTGPFTVGRHEVVWTASDSAGNTATAVQVVTVRDTRAPVVSAPGDRTVEASGDLTSVNLGNGTATDVVDGSIVPTPTPAGPFAVGIHTVTWRATDSAGNTGTDTQRVTVTQPDSSAPSITPPRNVTVEATGRLTVVNIGQAVAVDDEDGAVTARPSTEGPFPVGVTVVTWTASDAEGNTATATQRVTVLDRTAPQLVVPDDISTGASGVLTAIDLGEASAYDVVSGDVTPVADNSGPFTSGWHEITWTATDAAGNSTSAVQYVVILPQADFVIDQTVSEGSEVAVGVVLSGPAPDYPVVIPYRVSGTADNPYDHNAADGSIFIGSGLTGEAVFRTVDDGVNGEAQNTVVFEMQAPDNAVAGSSDRHVVTIIEDNSAPLVELDVAQAGLPARTVYPFEGPVVVRATVHDPNPGDEHLFDWSLSDNRLVSENGSSDFDFRIDPRNLSTGQYTLSVTVTDNGVPAESVTVDILLNVEQTPPVLSGRDDQDQDGFTDAEEGAGDVDQDGVPDYLDSIGNLAVLQGLEGVSGHHLLGADAGLKLRLGAIALTKGAGSAIVSLSDLDGSGAGDAFEYPGGVFDFVISGLSEHGQSVRVVLPQLVPLADNAVYRKYIPGSGWQDFVTDDRNRVASTRGSDGVCPAPGAAEWRDGLRSGDYCVRLTIEDGGPNDADGVRNGVIRDPGGAGSVPAAAGGGAGTSGGGGGGGGGGCTLGRPGSSADPLWLLMLAVAATGCLRRRLHFPH